MPPAMDSRIDRRIESVVVKLKRRQLVGSYNVGMGVVTLLADVVATANVPTFEALLDLVQDVGKRLQSAGRKEPVIQNMVLRVLKFLREEYNTALSAHIDSLVAQYAAAISPPSSNLDTPSINEQRARSRTPSGTSNAMAAVVAALKTQPLETPYTPFPAIPMETSASFTHHHQTLARQDSGYPWTSSQSARNATSDSTDDLQEVSRRVRDMSVDSAGLDQSNASSSNPASSSNVQAIGISSIFELLGHRDIHASVMSSSLSSGGSANASRTAGWTAGATAATPSGSGTHSPATTHSPTRVHSPGPAAVVSASRDISCAGPLNKSVTNLQQASRATQSSSPSSPASRQQVPSQSSSQIELSAAAAHAFPGLLHRQSSLLFPKTVLSAVQDAESDFSKKWATNKPVFVDAISELLDELATAREHIAQQATDHIHSAEIILTLGHSETVEAFLKAAARKRKITVVVAETAPTFLGRQFALALSAAGIPTLLVPDSAIFALMSRVSKVILGTHAVRADGSLVAISGSLPICRAAKAHLVPVIVCTGMFKVSNEFGFDAATSAALDECDNGSPAEVLRLSADGTGVDSMDTLGEAFLEGSELEVLAPYWDKVPQDLVSLFITNIGAHPSSMIFRLLKDLFE